MRTFTDAKGGEWQAAVMDGSYGTAVLMFGRIGGDEVLARSLASDVTNLAEAEDFVAALDETALRTMLGSAMPWDGGA